MTRSDLAHQVSTTLDGHAGDYDIDAIVQDIIDTHGMVANIDAVPTEEYWEIVERHDTTAGADEESEEYTALIGTSDDTVAGDHCDIEVTKEVGVGSPVLKTDLPVRTDDPDSLAKVEDAADTALADAGWERTSKWEIEDGGLRATVRRLTNPVTQENITDISASLPEADGDDWNWAEAATEAWLAAARAAGLDVEVRSEEVAHPDTEAAWVESGGELYALEVRNRDEVRAVPVDRDCPACQELEAISRAALETERAEHGQD